jgi:hypothetical protein
VASQTDAALNNPAADWFYNGKSDCQPTKPQRYGRSGKRRHHSG